MAGQKGCVSECLETQRVISRMVERRSRGTVASTAAASCEERDSHHRGRSGVTPAWSRSTHPRQENHHEQAEATPPPQFVGDKVQVKILRKRLKLTDEQFTSVLRKSGTSISAIAKEASTLK
jgi:hypothetical protein